MPYLETQHEALAWAAGFYEGEGYCGTTHDRRRVLPGVVITIHNTDLGMLERFQECVYGLGRIYGPYSYRGPDRKPMYRWAAQRFDHAQAVAAFLWPLLSDRRQDQIRAALGVYNTRRNERGLQ